MSHYQPNRFIENLVRSMTDAAVILDDEKNIVLFNDAYRKMVGVRAREMKNEPEQHLTCNKLVEFSICAQNCAKHAAQQSNRAASYHEIEMVKGARRQGVFIVTCIPLETAPPAFIETYREVSDERQLQDRYQHLLESERVRNDMLEELIVKRDVELEETRNHLIQTEKLRSLGLLVSGIAHELNNPINVISGNTGFIEEYTQYLLTMIDMACTVTESPEHAANLQRHLESEELRYIRNDVPSVLRSIKHASRRASDLTKSLTNFGRPNTERIAVSDLRYVVTDAILLLHHLFNDRVELELELPSMQVECDPSQIQQIVTNLVKNGYDAIGKNRGMVSVRLEDKTDVCILEVKDTGPGISSENLKHIFDPFFTTKDPGEGTGLGLYISHTIAVSHGGKLEASSEVAKGTTFRLTLSKKWRPKNAPAKSRPKTLRSKTSHAKKA